MDAQKIRVLLDSCFVAKRITETMEELPEGFKPRHIHVIECIATLRSQSEDVRVSDVSRELNITTPSVTKLINELEARAVLEKYSLDGDKRVTLLRLTALGQAYQHRYVATYHQAWAEGLTDVTDAQVDTVVEVLAKLQEAMPQRGQHV